jgi:DNA-binding SARP family transcriptional activator
MTWEASALPDDQAVTICLLGSFRLLKRGKSVLLRDNGKAEALLSTLALRPGHVLSREVLYDAIRPGSEPALAGHSLNSLLYSLHRLLGDALGGAAPVIHVPGGYQLNVESGVGVDAILFEHIANAGEKLRRAGNLAEAVNAYEQAVRIYQGDICVGADVHAIVERERLRVFYLTLLGRLADHYWSQQEYAACLGYALRLIAIDPCREDAHRQVMRCHVRCGERAQALRQYRLCEQILRREFDAQPEIATTALFDQARLDPASI